MWRLIFSLCLAVATCGQTNHPILAIDSPAPDFSLPGVDGKIHRLSDYAASPVLVVVFTCNHCPIAQMYEQRIQQLEQDYRGHGVAVVGIQPNDPKAIRIDDLDSSDISDSLDEMKIRVEYKQLHYPYLYDGETQSVTRAYGPQATPHVFVFDKDRKLRYEGRFDNSYRVEMVNTQDTRNAIDATLANREVPVKHTGVFGCSTKWQEKSASRLEAFRKMQEEPVNLEMATADDLKKLRANPTKHMILVSFWATWCGSCIDEFADFQDTFQMYKNRDLGLICGGKHAGRKGRRDENVGEEARHEPQSPLRVERHDSVANGIRPHLGFRLAVHRADRRRRQDTLQEARRRGYARTAPDDPCLPPVRLHRLQPALAGRCSAETARKDRRSLSR